MYENDPRYLPPPSRPGLGCAAKGCLTLLAVGTILGVMLVGAGWYLARNFAPYFDQQAAAVRVAPATDAQFQAVQEKLAPFVQAVSAGHAATLALTADDLNALIAHDPQFADARGKLYLAIDKGHVCADTSFQMNDEPTGSPQAVFFNGRATLDASYSSGEFTLVLRRVTPLDGTSATPFADWMFDLPNVSSAASREFNNRFHEIVHRNPAGASLVARLRTMIVKGDQVIVTAEESPTPVAPAPNSP